MGGSSDPSYITFFGLEYCQENRCNEDDNLCNNGKSTSGDGGNSTVWGVIGGIIGK